MISSKPSDLPGGPLAQLVEQLTLNQRAAGSIPARPTNISIGSGIVPKDTDFSCGFWLSSSATR
jgi:hypothetical protein